jgi:hypothetical protein
MSMRQTSLDLRVLPGHYMVLIGQELRLPRWSLLRERTYWLVSRYLPCYLRTKNTEADGSHTHLIFAIATCGGNIDSPLKRFRR